MPKLLSFLMLATTTFHAAFSASRCDAAGGSLTFRLVDEASQTPVICRVEFTRLDPSGRRQPRMMPVRKTVSAGIGVVVDREVVLELPDGPYQFRAVRGPEYRIVSGTFTLEKTSLDEKTIQLPRMVDMTQEGWLAGDCCVVPSVNSLPLRMAAEDLHVAAVLGEKRASPIPRRDADEPVEHSPSWIRTDATAPHGLLVYPDSNSADVASIGTPAAEPSSRAVPPEFGPLVRAAQTPDHSTRIAIENPFAWELPVWLASEQVNGVFVLGDWLRLDRRVMEVRDGRGAESFVASDPTQVGRHAEMIYRHLLNAGLPIVPLAGGGDQSENTPVGYNRLYVTTTETDSSDDSAAPQTPKLPSSADAWWEGVWRGTSVATNGPLLRPLVGGKLPGYVFQARSGEALRLQAELNLSVRDPVEYLEVIHNNRVHYSAPLDEFAKSGGVIPPIEATESGWIILRVLTLHEDHYRAAVTAPWWIEFDGQKRVAAESVAFFQQWLSEYEARLKRLPPDRLQAYVPFVQAARRFWNERESLCADHAE
jgi:hypothetical protein